MEFQQIIEKGKINVFSLCFAGLLFVVAFWMHKSNHFHRYLGLLQSKEKSAIEIFRLVFNRLNVRVNLT